MGTANKSSAQSASAGAVGRVSSIAGRAHRVKPSVDSETSKSPKKWYPQLEGLVHPEVVSAMRVMFDNLYQLRDQQHTASKTAVTQAASSGGGSSLGGGSGTGSGKSSLPDSAMATGIHGIRIQPATDPSSLKTGDTIRYNEATSQFEFGS